MNNIELQNIWKSYDQKIDKMLAINKELAVTVTKQKLNNQISKLYRPKWTAIVIGIPYVIILIIVTIIAFLAKTYFVAVGLGAIALITTILLINYFYHIYLISQVKSNDDILSTQQQLSKLKISSFNCLKMAIFQLPFWSICWMSINALKESPFIYGGINLLIFLLLSYCSYWLYNQLSYKNEKSNIRDFFLSGNEWEPILKSEEILKQIKEYKK